MFNIVKIINNIKIFKYWRFENIPFLLTIDVEPLFLIKPGTLLENQCIEQILMDKSF
jgi:hypothetical protein